jgi:hypothetical protein
METISQIVLLGPVLGPVLGVRYSSEWRQKQHAVRPASA